MTESPERGKEEEMTSYPTQMLLLTPALAQKWSNKTSHINREIRQWHVDELAECIRAGKMVPSTIYMKPKSGIVNGAHRCLAVIKAGMPILVTVVELPEDFDVTELDEMRQTKADILQRRTGTRVTSEVAGLAQTISYVHGGSVESCLDRARQALKIFGPYGRRSAALHVSLDPDNPTHIEFAEHFTAGTLQQAAMLNMWLRRGDVVRKTGRQASTGKHNAVLRALKAWKEGKTLTERMLSTAADMSLGKRT